MKEVISPVVVLVVVTVAAGARVEAAMMQIKRKVPQWPALRIIRAQAEKGMQQVVTPKHLLEVPILRVARQAQETQAV